MAVAVVTGASRGLGRAIAEVLASAGYDLALGARSVDDLRALADELTVDTLVGPLDVADPVSVGGFRDRVTERWPEVDVVVANAGIGHFDRIATFDVDVFDRLFAVNVRGVLLTLQAFTPALRAAAAGQAVVVTSDVSTRVFPGGGPYCATKWAARALVRTYQQEHPDLRVVELRPGATDTAFGDTVEGDAGPGHLTAREVAEALLGAIEAPPHVRVEELVVRSAEQRPDF